MTSLIQRILGVTPPEPEATAAPAQLPPTFTLNGGWKPPPPAAPPSRDEVEAAHGQFIVGLMRDAQQHRDAGSEW